MMRPETEHAYHNASNYIERLMIAFWVHDGWDRLWPWTMVPKWLAPRYDWHRMTQHDDTVDFSCRVCGSQCDIAPDPPARAVCPTHCEDHDYRYERELRGHFCFHCGQEAPQDWFD